MGDDGVGCADRPALPGQVDANDVTMVRYDLLPAIGKAEGYGRAAPGGGRSGQDDLDKQLRGLRPTGDVLQSDMQKTGPGHPPPTGDRAEEHCEPAAPH